MIGCAGKLSTQFLAVETVRPRKRLRAENAQSRDKFNLSNDHLYEVAKEGGRHRVRQTFGQLVVEHAYSAQKLQLPFVSLSTGNPRSVLLDTTTLSTRPDFPNKKRVPSTDQLCSSPPTLKFVSAKCGLRRRRKTKQGERSGRVATSARDSTRRAI